MRHVTDLSPAREDPEDPRGGEGRWAEPESESTKGRKRRLKKLAKPVFVLIWFIFCTMLMAGGIFSLQTGREGDDDCSSTVPGAADEILCVFKSPEKRKTWTTFLRL